MKHAPPSDSGILANKKPAAISRAGRSIFSDDGSMQVFCPTGQAILGKHEGTGVSGTYVKLATTHHGRTSGLIHRVYQSSISSPLAADRSGFRSIVAT